MTVAACGSKYLRTPSDETSFLTWQISRQTVDYAEAWIGKQVITGTFREFLGKESLTLRTDRKEESNVFECIHKVSDFENFTAAGHDGKIKAMASAVHKNFALGSFEVTLAWTPYTCPLIVEALSYPLPRHLLESKPHCSTLSTRTSEMVLASILCKSTKPRKASSTSKLSVRYLTQTESYVFVDSSIVSSAITLKNFDFSICLTILSRISTPRQEINSFWICRDR